MGRALTRLLPEADARHKSDLDVTDAAAVADAVAGHDVVVHLAAMTDVDGAEVAPSVAEDVNDRGTANVAAAARLHAARVVYLSTDYVFRGDTPPYGEGDRPDPVNVYGRTKLAGETHLDGARDIVVRTSWVYGDGRNFISAILDAATKGPVTVVDDQFGRPTAAADVATAVAFVVEAGLSGILHIAGDGRPCSWADLAETALREAGSPAVVTRVDTETYAAGSPKAVAPRPRDATLSLERARTVAVPLVDWRTSVAAYVRDLA